MRVLYYTIKNLILLRLVELDKEIMKLYWLRSNQPHKSMLNNLLSWEIKITIKKLFEPRY